MENIFVGLGIGLGNGMDFIDDCCFYQFVVCRMKINFIYMIFKMVVVVKFWFYFVGLKFLFNDFSGVGELIKSG